MAEASSSKAVHLRCPRCGDTLDYEPPADREFVAAYCLCDSYWSTRMVRETADAGADQAHQADEVPVPGL